ncbi:DUF3383 family protein [Oscillospiraceae bacterium 50-16]
MSNNLSRIVDITIELQSVVSSGANFDTILIVGPGPKNPGATPPPDVGVYYELGEVNEAGWVSEGADADPVGTAARVAFSQTTKPSQIFIAVQKPVEETVDEADDDPGAVKLESPNLTLSRAEEAETGWYVALAAGIPESDLEIMAEWTESREKIFGYAYGDPADNPVSNIYYRTFGVCYGETPNTIPADRCMHVAIAVRFLSYPTGSETWVNKSLAAVNISKFSSTVINSLEKDPASYYIKIGNTGLVQGGKVRAGEWIDVIRFRDWLKNDMQLRIINTIVKNSKIPYTDKGIGIIHNQMIASLKEGVRREGIAEDAYDEEGNRIPGYITSVPLAANLTDEQKASRKLIDCKFSAILAGAIHAVKVNGALVYSY